MSALAEQIVLVEATSALTPSESGDGFGSTVNFRVDESLKGDIAVGDTIQLRQISRAESQVSTDLDPEVGQRFLLLLSSSLYGLESAERGGSPSNGGHVQALPGYRLEGDSLAPLGVGQPQVAGIAAARASAARFAGKSGSEQ